MTYFSHYLIFRNRHWQENLRKVKKKFFFLFTQLFIFIPSFSLDCLVKSTRCDNVKYSENKIDQHGYLKKMYSGAMETFFRRAAKKKIPQRRLRFETFGRRSYQERRTTGRRH